MLQILGVIGVLACVPARGCHLEYRGTTSTIELAEKQGIPVRRIEGWGERKAQQEVLAELIAAEEQQLGGREVGHPLIAIGRYLSDCREGPEWPPRCPAWLAYPATRFTGCGTTVLSAPALMAQGVGMGTENKSAVKLH